METVGYISILIMGITLGLLGGGGSILTVPIMVYLFQMSPTIATSYSLFIVGLTSLIGSAIYFKKGDIDFRIALSFAIPSTIGINLSRGLIVPNLPTTIFSLGRFAATKEILTMATFAILMIAASYSMIKNFKDKAKPKIQHPLRLALITIEGLAVGLISGFVGAGGGFLIIPALVQLAGLSMRVAIGTSLLIIALQSLAGFANDLTRGSMIDWLFIGTIAPIAVFGIFVGSKIAPKIKEKNLKFIFGCFVLVAGISILLDQIQRLSAK